jgi:hypothetical protein
MELIFMMGNMDVNAHYTLPNGRKYTIIITVPSCDIMKECAVKYKPIKIYGTKRKRSRKESK